MHFHLYLFVLSNSLAFVYVEVSQKRTKKLILGGFSDKKMAKISTTKKCVDVSKFLLAGKIRKVIMVILIVSIVIIVD